MSIAGNWNIVTKSPMGSDESSLDFAIAGTVLSGKMAGKDGETEIFEGSVDGNSANWKAKIEKPMPLVLEFSVDVDGDAVSGKVKLGGFGEATLTGTRA